MTIRRVGPDRENKTINQAYAIADSGDILWIDEGIYEERVAMSSKYVHLLANTVNPGAGKVIIKSEIENQRGLYFYNISGSPIILIEGIYFQFLIEDANVNYDEVIEINNCNGLTILFNRCIIDATRDWYYVFDGTGDTLNIELDNCRIIWKADNDYTDYGANHFATGCMYINFKLNKTILSSFIDSVAIQNGMPKPQINDTVLVKEIYGYGPNYGKKAFKGDYSLLNNWNSSNNLSMFDLYATQNSFCFNTNSAVNIDEDNKVSSVIVYDWAHVVGVYNYNQFNVLFVNGEKTSKIRENDGLFDDGKDFNIAFSSMVLGDSGAYVKIEDVRFSNISRSDYWIKIANHSLKDNLITYSTPGAIVLDYDYCIKITIDNTNIDSSVSHFPIPIVLGASVGKNNQNVTEIFDELFDQDVDDSFTTLNHEHWSYPDIEAQDLFSHDVVNNRLKFTRNESDAYLYTITSKFSLVGDFDIQLDFGLDTEMGTAHNQAARLLISAPGWNAIILRYGSSNYNGYYWSATGSSPGYTHGNDLVGKLRITREGTSVKVYSWNGTSWTYRQGSTNTNINDMTVSIAALQQNSFLLTSWIDNFIVNSGSIGWPNRNSPTRKKMAITKDDGITELYCEIEYWNSITKEAVLWVSKHDFVLNSASSTDLYLYYDSTQSKNDNYIGDTEEESVVTNISGSVFIGPNNDAPDKDLWIVNNNSVSGTCDIQNNKLKMYIPTTYSNESLVVESVFKLSGDFDIQIDYNEISNGSTSSSTLYPSALMVSNDSVMIKIGSKVNDLGIHSSFIESTNIRITNGDDFYSFGRYKIIRNSGSFTVHHWSGTQWEWNSDTSGYTFSDSNSSDLYVGFMSSVGEHSWATTDFDNFVVVSGTVKYKPAQRVWDDNFKAVYHMAQEPSPVTGSILDSTGNEKHGTPSKDVSSANMVDGALGKAIDFYGPDFMVSCGDINVSIVDGFTLECGVNLTPIINNVTNYYFEGNVNDILNIDNNTVWRVKCFNAITNEFMSDTLSDAVTGNYFLETIYSGEHFIICEDADINPNYNDLILGRMIPKELY